MDRNPGKSDRVLQKWTGKVPFKMEMRKKISCQTTWKLHFQTEVTGIPDCAWEDSTIMDRINL